MRPLDVRDLLSPDIERKPTPDRIRSEAEAAAAVFLAQLAHLGREVLERRLVALGLDGHPEQVDDAVRADAVRELFFRRVLGAELAVAELPIPARDLRLVPRTPEPRANATSRHAASAASATPCRPGNQPRSRAAFTTWALTSVRTFVRPWTPSRVGESKSRRRAAAIRSSGVGAPAFFPEPCGRPRFFSPAVAAAGDRARFSAARRFFFSPKKRKMRPSISAFRRAVGPAGGGVARAKEAPLNGIER